MVELKSNPRCKYQIAYHFVWIPKYREHILKSKIKDDLEYELKKIVDDYKLSLLALEIMEDHIHIFVSSGPEHSPSKLIRLFKGITARRLRVKHDELRQHKHLWTPSYFVATHGNVSSETIRRYIEECQQQK